MSTVDDVLTWLDRIDAVEARLQALATPRAGLTEPDPESGERWEPGQVWGHLTEFIQYWIEQVGDVIDAYAGEPVAFGRMREDPGRLAAIDQGKRGSMAIMWAEVRSDLADLRAFLRALPEGWDRASGLHPRRGVTPAGSIIEDFLVSHLEEHATQLENVGQAAG